VPDIGLFPDGCDGCHVPHCCTVADRRAWMGARWVPRSPLHHCVDGFPSRLHGCMAWVPRSPLLHCDVSVSVPIGTRHSAIVARVRFSHAPSKSVSGRTLPTVFVGALFGKHGPGSSDRYRCLYSPKRPQRAETRRRLTGRTRLTGGSSLTSQPPSGAWRISRTRRRLTAQLRWIWAKPRGSKALMSSLSWRTSVRGCACRVRTRVSPPSASRR